MPSPSSSPVVELRGLRKTYEPAPWWLRLMARSAIRHPVTALDGVDLDVARGEICAVVGPNGAGKTTMFKILSGLTTSTSGRVSVLGLDPDRRSIDVRRVIGWMPADDRSLFMRMTAFENLWFHGRLHGMATSELRSAIPAVLEQLGLGEKVDTTVLGLSAGMRARLQLARAILHRPQLLILDEPTGSIDPVAAHGLLSILRSLVSELGLAAVVSSHRLEEIEALEEHVVLLDHGRVLFDGHLDALRARGGRPLLELVFASERAAEAAAADLAGTATTFQREGTQLVGALAVGESPGQVVRRLGRAGEALLHVREHPIPLRDLLAELYADEHVEVGP